MRRPSDVLVSTGTTWVPVSDGPKVSMTRATIWRDSHRPHACSEGRTAAICRRVRLLTAAAARERSDPRSSLSIAGVQHQMMTFVNVTIKRWKCSSAGSCPLDGVGGWVFTRDIEHTFENRVIPMMQEVLL